MSNQKNKTIRWDVFDKRNRWMGGYSTKLDEIHSTSSFTMAEINAGQCAGKIIQVFENGESLEVNQIKRKK